MKLKIHKDHWKSPPFGTLGMTYLLGSLNNQEQFDLSYHEDHLKCMKDFRASIIYADDLKIYVDFWDYGCPTYTNEVLNGNFDLIIKLQHRKMDAENYFVKECRERKIYGKESDQRLIDFQSKIVPWTFFPSKWFETFIGNEGELFNETNSIDGFFCGKDWRCRRTVKRWMGMHKMEYMCSDQGTRFGKTLTNDDFLKKMKESKLGFVFHGRSSVFTEAKNRREIDYMMMKKPLVLNYEPFYHDPLIKGVHYIRWMGESPKDLEKKYNLNKIANEGHQWYLRNATPSGIISSFKDIVSKYKTTKGKL